MMRSIRVGIAMSALLALGAGLSGCGGTAKVDTETASRLVATWRLVRITGGYTGGGQRPTPVEELTFNPNGTFQRIQNGVNASGNYTILERKTILFEGEVPVITYTPQTLPDIITVLDDTHLTVNEEASDSYVREYERVTP